MAKIEMDGKEIEVKDGECIKKACEELGVAFSCENGVCGVCMIDVVEGKENLSEPTEAEKDFGFDEKSEQRLACQCKIRKGKLKIRY